MVPEYENGPFYLTDDGAIPVDAGAPDDFDGETASGWFCRLSAPGYMDATDWNGPYSSEDEARQAIRDDFGACDKCGNDLLETADRCPTCEPFTVVVSDRDRDPDGDEAPAVTLIVEGEGAAEWATRVHQTLGGSSWEAAGDTFAYNMQDTYPGCFDAWQKEMPDAEWDFGQASEPSEEEHATEMARLAAIHGYV
jgi:hypothetical protein